MIPRFNREFVSLYYLHENPVIASVAFLNGRGRGKGMLEGEAR